MPEVPVLTLAPPDRLVPDTRTPCADARLPSTLVAITEGLAATSPLSADPL